MYNSLFVSFMMKIANFVSGVYRYSLIHKIQNKIKNFNKKVASGSKIRNFFSDYKVFKNSNFKKFVYGFFGGLSILFKNLKNFNAEISKDSEVADTFGYATQNINSGLKLIYEIFFFLGTLMFFTKLLGILDYSYKISLSFVLLWFLGRIINSKEILILKNSAFLNFFLDIFRLDKGGESWW